MTDAAYPDLALVIDGEVIGAGAARRYRRDRSRHRRHARRLCRKATTADLDRALDAAAARLIATGARRRSTRASASCKKTAALIRERADDIGRIATLEQGKPLNEAIGETIYAASLFEWYGRGSRAALMAASLVRPPGQLDA